MADVVHHQFLPWVRQGLAAAITTTDPLGGPPPAEPPGRMTVTVPVLGDGADHDDSPVSVHLAVRGAGDVIGIERSQIIRTDPHDQATDAEPNYFAIIEFDRPDFPWLFTPFAPTTEDRLRPWLVLVVVDRDGDHASTLSPGQPLPTLSVPAEAADQLPPLAESWLWAHAQVTPSDGQSVLGALTGDPRANLSRLVCPRRLHANRRYLACVVPAFEAGRKAGLGQDPADADEVAPAWTSGAPVVLPVYASFEFSTGMDGDFETLARRLQARPVPPGVGTRPLDIGHAGSGLPDVDATGVGDTRAVLGLDGALRNPGTAPTPWDEGARQAFQLALAADLDGPARLAQPGGAGQPGTRTVGPPIYGQFHARCAEVDVSATPPWLAELNLDPRTRVAAGLGGQVVDANEEDFMERSWRQIGDVLRANRLLRAAQLARAASARVLVNHLRPLAAGDLLQVSAAVHARVAGPGGPASTLRAAIRASVLPDAMSRTAFRRLVRPDGPIARRAPSGTSVGALVAEVATGITKVAVPASVPDGTLSLRPPSVVLGPERAAEVLAAVEAGAPAQDGASRFDAFVTAVNEAAKPLPAASELAARGPAQGVTAAGVLDSVGLVGATAVVAAIPPGIRPRVIPAVEGPIRLATPGLLGARFAAPATPPTSASAVGPPARRAEPAGAEPRAPAPAGAIGQVLLDGGSRLSVIGSVADRDVTIDTAGGVWVNTVAIDTIARTGLEVLRIPHTEVDQVVQTGTFTLPRVTPRQLSPLPSDAAVVVDLAASLRATVGEVISPDLIPALAPLAMLEPVAVQTSLLGALDPEITVVARLNARLTIPVARTSPDPLDVVMACPTLPDATYVPLRYLSQDWILPGLDKVPADTVTLVETNPAFVVSYLVGLNHEMARLLLWREYPTDQRGTVFQRFWGRTTPPVIDVGPVHQFHGHLTDNVTGGAQPSIVLLVRGELLRRYPGSLIYAAEARQVGGDIQLDDSTITWPDFRGDLLPDVTFIGFPLTLAQIRGSDGKDWWFVIARQPTEPRFGLDDPDGTAGAGIADWNALNWGHLAASPDQAGSVTVALASAPQLAGVVLDGVRWAQHAGAQAHITYQHPVRVGIRAVAMLPSEAPHA